MWEWLSNNWYWLVLGWIFLCIIFIFFFHKLVSPPKTEKESNKLGGLF